MDDILERRTKGFSQGQRIKVALARTLLHRPRHLLLDEPSRGLDVMSTRALRRALNALRADGCCVIMATHVMQEVTHLCDDVIVIAKGHTVAQGSPQRAVPSAPASPTWKTHSSAWSAPKKGSPHEVRSS